MSDLHLNTIFKRENIKKLKQTLKHSLKIGFDHLVITGDIADNAEEKEFLILRKMLKSFDLLDSKRVSIVVGNHDIFGGVQTAMDVINFPNRCFTTNYFHRINLFYSCFEELFSDTIVSSNKDSFPYVKYLDDHAFVGLNSIDHYSRLKNPFASNGKISKLQLSSLVELMQDAEWKFKKKIIMTHHHFYKHYMDSTASRSNIWNNIESFTMNLRGKKKLLNFFRENDFPLVLHGHSHEMKEYYRKGIRFLNAGASIDNHSNHSSFFVINSARDNTSVKLVNVPSKTITSVSLYIPKLIIPKIARQFNF